MIFKVMRIIWPQIIHLEGIGSIWFFVDIKYGRQWAKKWDENDYP